MNRNTVYERKNHAYIVRPSDDRLKWKKRKKKRSFHSLNNFCCSASLLASQTLIALFFFIVDSSGGEKRASLRGTHNVIAVRSSISLSFAMWLRVGKD